MVDHSSSDAAGSADPFLRSEDYRFNANLLKVVQKHNTPQTSNHEYVWQDDAACGGVDVDLFTLKTKEDEGYEDCTAPELKKLNLAMVEQANKNYCGSCPVRKTCLSSADPSDLFWTIRGGQAPTRLADPKKKRVPNFNYGDYVLWACKKHGREYVGKKGHKNKKGVWAEYAFCRRCDWESKNPDRPR